MIEAAEIDSRRYAVTDGEIALVNLDNARRRSWDRFARGPMLSGAAERIVEEEQLSLEFTGDVEALDRLEVLANALERCDPQSARTALVQAQIASAAHRFADARRHLADARLRGAPEADVERQVLCVDQACGTRLESVLDARRSLAEASGRLDDLVPLGAALAEMDRFEDADGVYRKALDAYDDVSPFPLAWTCFQLGQLWGELAHDPDASRAAKWYRSAIEYLPSYVKARVHLSEIHTGNGELGEARALLEPALSSGDPEVPWRLADVLALQGDGDKAALQLRTARDGFEALLAKQPLAFADHGAEFYLGSGNDPVRASELARLNLANRPTARAFELHAHASDRCGGSPCPIAEHS
jgi:tetratricopeptide (TPR) repeat protein